MPLEPKHHEHLLTAGILAGGAGRRAGGQDKGWIEWQGQALIEQVITRIEPQVKSILISANRNLERYETLGYPVITDTDSTLKGPLAGIQKLLSHCKTEWLVIVPCDMPELPANIVGRLWANLGDNAQPVVASVANRAQYCCVLLHRTLAASAATQLANQQYRLGDWLRAQNMIEVAFDDQPEAFKNMNSFESPV